MSLFVDKEHTLHSDPVAIQARNLTPHSLFQLKLLLKHDQGTFRAYAVFQSDAQGVIDVAKLSPIRGTYAGVRPMGLFESLEPLSDFREGGYAGWEFGQPWRYELSLLDAAGNVIDTKSITKNYLAPSVERIEVSEGRLRGSIFKPKGNGPFPAVIDMTGTGGGLRENRAALLANEGFCVFTIAFFSFKDLPENMLEVDFEYFQEAAEFLSNLPYTHEHIGVHGNSFGGAIVLLMAKLCPKVKSVVSINPPHYLSDVAHINYKGEPFPHAFIEPTNIIERNSYIVYDKVIQGLVGNDEIDFHPEKSQKDVAFRFIVSLDDQSTCPLFSVLKYSERLKKSGFYVEMHSLPGGHLMEPPYFPHHTACYSKFGACYMAYGGEYSQHGASQPVAWNATIDFFKKTLASRQEVAQSKL